MDDDRVSRRACRDGSVHTVRWSSSAADVNRHAWLGYNGHQSMGFASPQHERIPLSWSEEERSHSAPSSRSSSPGARSSSRSWVPNFSRLLPSRTASLSTIMGNRSAAESVESLRYRLRGSNIKRWDPTWRTTTPWDNLRKDPELWYEHGDCLVHLYAKGHSKRGPALRVPLDAIRANNLASMFGLRHAHIYPVYELFIPAPNEYVKESAFRWHLTTRNFFAFLFGKPLVGEQLGKTLIDLQERIHLFRPGNSNNDNDLMEYLENLGYLEFAHCPDYSLGLLQFAEHYELKELWIDAFTHCVGMNEILSESPEFLPTSRITQQLITSAYLKVRVHLTEVSRALSNFLEDELSPSYLGLSQGARAHLEYFRSFLHSFYVEKFGYWPPQAVSGFPKALYKSMYFDFRNLYDLLVDLESTGSIQDQKPASGGICVLQNVQAFDRRHKYLPLPHPMPLLPDHSDDRSRNHSQRERLALKLGTKQAKTERYNRVRTALANATNAASSSIAKTPLVKAYQRFEREWIRMHEEKVSIRDARKVRWLLIYGCLQMLVSAIRAPKEVKDTDGPTYPLCCLVPSTLPWAAAASALNGEHIPSINHHITDLVKVDSKVPSAMKKSLPSALEMLIRPDCETDDYFSHAHASHGPPTRGRPPTAYGIPTNLSRSTSNLFRNASVRSVKRLSFVPRRNSVIVKPPISSFCEILVHGYGNGLNKTIVDPPPIRPSFSNEEPVSPVEITVSRHSYFDENAEQDDSGLEMAGRRKARPSSLVIQKANILEKRRTPFHDSFDVERMQDPTPDLEESVDISNGSSSEPLSPHWSSRSGTSSSGSSAEALPALVSSGVTRNNSVLSNSSTALSPVSPIEPEVRYESEPKRIIIKRSFSVESFVNDDPKPMDMYPALAMPPALQPRRGPLIGGSVLEVYQPTGMSLSNTGIKRHESLRSKFLSARATKQGKNEQLRDCW